MLSIKKHISNNGILFLAILFVSYHLFSTVVGLISFGKLLFWTDERVVVESTQENVESTSSKDLRMSQIVYGYSVDQRQWPNRIVITPAQINIGIVGSPKNIDWIVSDQLATYDTNSALPGNKIGNTIIFGRSVDGPFVGLGRLALRDEILLQTEQRDYIYMVTGFSAASSQEIIGMTQTPEPTLTIISAASWLAEPKSIVTASLSREVIK